MINQIWKNKQGEFLRIENPTYRENKILEWAGCVSFESPEEFIKRLDDRTKDLRVVEPRENFSTEVSRP